MYLSNWDATPSGIPTVPTNVKATNNIISDAALNNTISGLGYNTAYCGALAFCYPIHG